MSSKNPDPLDTCRVRVVHQERVEQARRKAIPEPELERLALTYKVLGDPTRLRIVIALRDDEMCVCDLAAYLGLTDSAVSHQLRRLKDLALIRQRRKAQVLYCSLNDDHVLDLLNIGLEHVREK